MVHVPYIMWKNLSLYDVFNYIKCDGIRQSGWIELTALKLLEEIDGYETMQMCYLFGFW